MSLYVLRVNFVEIRIERWVSNDHLAWEHLSGGLGA